MQATKSQKTAIDRQPFTVEQAVKFCGTKKLAKELLVDLGEALFDADRARRAGDSDDVAFELNFWNGIQFITEDEMYDLGILDASGQTHAFLACAKGEDDALDAVFYFCETGDGRKFVLVDYNFNDSQSAWWLTRDDHLGQP